MSFSSLDINKYLFALSAIAVIEHYNRKEEFSRYNIIYIILALLTVTEAVLLMIKTS